MQVIILRLIGPRTRTNFVIEFRCRSSILKNWIRIIICVKFKLFRSMGELHTPRWNSFIKISNSKHIIVNFLHVTCKGDFTPNNDSMELVIWDNENLSISSRKESFSFGLSKLDLQIETSILSLGLGTELDTTSSIQTSNFWRIFFLIRIGYLY